MISVFGSDIGDDEIFRATEVMRSQWLGFGSKVEQFERAFADYRDFKNFVMVDSGSNALYMAVKLLDLPSGSEVIVPSFTWVSCAQAVLMANCVPVFCDVDPRTMNVRREDIEARLSSRTSAIMVVHYAGLAVDLDPILELGLPVIEDAAHAVSSSYKGKSCGGISDIGIFSFDSVKNLAVGEGGGLCVNSDALIERAKRLRYCGIGKSGFEAAMSSSKGNPRWWEYHIGEPFIKMLPTNVAAAIGLGQLDRLATLQSRRKQIWETYDLLLGQSERVTIPVHSSSGDSHSYFTYCIQVEHRDELANYLLGAGIYTTLRYHPLHLNPLYGQTHVSLPNCELLNKTALNIPLHPRLTDDEVELIAKEIISFTDSAA